MADGSVLVMPTIPTLTRLAGKRDRRLAESMDNTLLALQAMERMVDMSSDIIDGVQEGESYEVLVRGLVCLNENLRALGHLSRVARMQPVTFAE